ncbi:MAG: 4-hydroxythreonine-4-phosphate dehydrogenase PdxA [Pseudomonadota bacterium]
MSATPLIVISAGEPAGIGPDLCLLLAARDWPARLAVVGDPELLRQRARLLGITLNIVIGVADAVPSHAAGTLYVVPESCAAPCVPGELNTANSDYVLRVLRRCAALCLDGSAGAMVTAPVHKGVINDAGISFSGHTEFLAELCNAPLPVMLLCAGDLRVALVTTHLPLSAVSAAITPQRLRQTLEVLQTDLQQKFGFAQPRISVCGLNPHAGEGGHLGREEIDVITPVLDTLRETGMALKGPLPADTLFTPRHLNECDAVLAMYHDQGLTTLKYAGFGRAINVTLGLPIVRTSVDHGTALDLAGRGECDSGSMIEALRLAIASAHNRIDNPSVTAARCEPEREESGQRPDTPGASRAT